MISSWAFASSKVLLHGGTYVGRWTAKQIHHALTTFGLSERSYGLNQFALLRKLKGHRVPEPDRFRYAYPRFKEYSSHLFLSSKRVCGPLANETVKVANRQATAGRTKLPVPDQQNHIPSGIFERRANL
jgi:hypothetical protein